MKEQIESEKLGLIVFNSAKELGNSVNEHLLDLYGIDKNKYTFIIPIKELFFEDGHLKVEINSTVRGKNLYFITDVCNYGVTYKMHGIVNHASPNDLMTQLKDGIGASNCHAKSINIVMPLLYQGRQHRRNTRENLACGANLRELDNLPKVKSFITFDAHDEGVEHAIHNMEFDNFYATNTIIENFIKNTPKEELRNLVFVAPDNGATGRRNVYLNSFNSEFISREAGSFIKQRDYNNFVDGKYPVISHDYCGNNDLNGKTAIVVDDMISSGSSMFDVIEELNKKGVSHIYIMVTFALFTKGIEEFNKYYESHMIDGVYTTNLSYIPESYQKAKWLHVCDCSSQISQAIYDIEHDLSITGLLTDKSVPNQLLEEKFKDEMVLKRKLK